MVELSSGRLTLCVATPSGQDDYFQAEEAHSSNPIDQRAREASMRLRCSYRPTSADHVACRYTSNTYRAAPPRLYKNSTTKDGRRRMTSAQVKLKIFLTKRLKVQLIRLSRFSSPSITLR